MASPAAFTLPLPDGNFEYLLDDRKWLKYVPHVVLCVDLLDLARLEHAPRCNKITDAADRRSQSVSRITLNW